MWKKSFKIFENGGNKGVETDLVEDNEYRRQNGNATFQLKVLLRQSKNSCEQSNKQKDN